jgi:hypothetical protein
LIIKSPNGIYKDISMENSENLEIRKNERYGIGLTVLILLAVLTIGEYGLGIVGANWITIFLAIAAFKAFLVLRDYMHFGRLFSSEGERHE